MKSVRPEDKEFAPNPKKVIDKEIELERRRSIVNTLGDYRKAILKKRVLE